MTSVWKRFGLGLVVIATASVSASGAPQMTGRDPLAPLPTPDLPPPPAYAPPAYVSPAPTASPPIYLRDRVTELGRAFDGKAGIAIVSLRDGWEIGWNANALFPQQSCSKLWVAIAAMDAVDRGQISLSDRVTLGRSDLTLFHQPLRAKILGKGDKTITLGSLLFTAITESDNTANDKLMRSIGGPERVREMITRKNLGAIRFYNGERALQSRIAGLIWSPSYSIGNAFYQARSALPMSVRKAAFERYVTDPYDGAAPHAVANALARLKRGDLLSPASSQRLLSTMGQTRTGRARVRAALPAGWKWYHKTGTGQDFQGRISGINDIGLVSAPDGTSYAVAIMTVPRNNSDGDAQKLMQQVARSVVAQHAMRYGAVAQRR